MGFPGTVGFISAELLVDGAVEFNPAVGLGVVLAGAINGIAVVRVTGEVDVASCGVLRESLLRVVTDEGFRGLVVNLAAVRFIDSTGVGVLVGVWRRVRATSGPGRKA